MGPLLTSEFYAISPSLDFLKALKAVVLTSPSGHPWMRTLSTFTTRLLNLGKVPRKEKIKVAILDDGVDPEFKGLGPLLANTGWPSERLDDEGPPFYYSTKGHGSEMAWLISYACPFVELCVAKIDTPQDDSLPHPTYSVKQAATVGLASYLLRF